MEVVLFTAVASAGGSGSSTTLALLDNEKQGLTNLFPSQFFLKEVSSYQFWTDAAVSDALIFVTADFVWASDECHFCAHRYTIGTYAYNAQTGRYILRDQYTTASKYAAPSSVLKAEKPQILLHLQKKNH
jgi:hypothetical protein